MGGVGSREPVGRDKVVQPKCVESNFKSAKVEVAMGPLVATTRGWVGKNRGTAVSTCLNEYCLG